MTFVDGLGLGILFIQGGCEERLGETIEILKWKKNTSGENHPRPGRTRKKTGWRVHKKKRQKGSRSTTTGKK